MEIGPEPIGPPKRSGCRLALYTIFGLGLFAIVAVGIALWLFLESEQGQRVVEAAKQGASWMTEASQAPGTAELREAGCNNALVSEMSKAIDTFMAFLPDETQKSELLEEMESAGGLETQWLVMCSLSPLGATEPDCGELARTYADAVPSAPESFLLVVLRQGDDAPSCRGIYSADGTLVRTPAF